MKDRSLARWTAGALAAALMLAGGLAISGDNPSAAPPITPEQQQAMMEQAIAAARPGENHKILAEMAGDWDVAITMSFPGMAPTLAKGTAHAEMVLGGRFLQVTTDADPMPGMTERAVSITYYGHDNRFGKYFMWGVDTLGTYAVDASGAYDAAAKTIVMEGATQEPGYGEAPFRWNVKVDSVNHHALSIDFKAPGGDFVTMFTMDFTRRK